MTGERMEPIQSFGVAGATTGLGFLSDSGIFCLVLSKLVGQIAEGLLHPHFPAVVQHVETEAQTPQAGAGFSHSMFQQVFHQSLVLLVDMTELLFRRPVWSFL